VPKATAFYSHIAEFSDIQETSSGAICRCAFSAAPDTPIPEVQLLSNGRYNVMVTNAGGGYKPMEGPRSDTLARRQHLRQLGHVLLFARCGKRRVLVYCIPADT